MANDFIENMKMYDPDNERLQDKRDFMRNCISILKENLQSTLWQQKNMMIDQGPGSRPSDINPNLEAQELNNATPSQIQEKQFKEFTSTRKTSTRNQDDGVKENNQKEGNLYFVKQAFWRDIKNIKVKLQNMELWILDYKERDDEKAQILQLKFMSDLFYEQDSFGKNMSCSQRSPIEQVNNQANYFQTKNVAMTSMDS